MNDKQKKKLRNLPSVSEVCCRPEVASLIEIHGRSVVVHAIRDVIDRTREELLSGSCPADADITSFITEEKIAEEISIRIRPELRRVINATGVILHTNLGRAPMAPEAVAAVASVGGGYACLEIDLVSGGRGKRESYVSKLLCGLLDCEDAIVVNNGAAAVLLILQELAAGKEVIVSRGELVEIGGGFRVPDVMERSGCRLIEVGTTNRTRISDYKRAAGPETGALLKVHRSNFEIVGFTESADIAELSALGDEIGVPLIHDLGSGLLHEGLLEIIGHEMTPAMSLKRGSSIVSFSGDKLLGGPQCGIIAGKREIIRRLAKHPLMRAIRCDKLTLSALEATLRLYRDERAEEIPVLRMLQTSKTSLEERAKKICELISKKKLECKIAEVFDAVGGGAAPLVQLSGIAVELSHSNPEKMMTKLRNGVPSVLAVLREDRIRLHLRTVPEDETEALAEAVICASD